MIRLVKENLVRNVDSEAKAKIYEARGYERQAEPKPEDEDFDFNKMKVDELKAFAADKGIELGDATLKADIIEAITKAEVPSEE